MSFFSKLWERITGAPASPPAADAAEHAAPDAPNQTAITAAASAPPARAPEDRDERPQGQGADAEDTRRWSDGDDESLEERARALGEAGDAAGALDLLSREGMLLVEHVAHDRTPCLCRRCLVPDVTACEAGGITFQRDFVVARRRVLFYWAPAELGADPVKLRFSMRNALRARVHELQLARRRLRPRVNPFTGQPLS